MALGISRLAIPALGPGQAPFVCATCPTRGAIFAIASSHHDSKCHEWEVYIKRLLSSCSRAFQVLMVFVVGVDMSRVTFALACSLPASSVQVPQWRFEVAFRTNFGHFEGDPEAGLHCSHAHDVTAGNSKAQRSANRCRVLTKQTD
jgi:hypothetical protein